MSPLSPETYWEPHCDDCDESLVEMGCEYAAWKQRDQAVEQWIEWGNWATPDGEVLLCAEHAPHCSHGEWQDYRGIAECDDCPDPTVEEERALL